MRRNISLLFFMILVSGNTVMAQPDEVEFNKPVEGQAQYITFDDGSKIIGKIVEIYSDSVDFESAVGLFRIAKERIKEIRVINKESIKDGDYWFENPNASRMYLFPTGRMINKGDGYFSDYWLFFPAFGYGLLDNITIGGGFSIFPRVDFDDQVFYLTPKIGVVSSKNTNIAVGALIMGLPIDDDEKPIAGIAYGISTFGGADGSISMGLGYGFVNDEFIDKPMIIIGGEKRFTRKLSFVSEN